MTRPAAGPQEPAYHARMTTRGALLEGVYANPADDLPRLVLADYLDETGEPDWAELIRVQTALVNTPTDPALLARQDALLAEPDRFLDPADRECFELVTFRPVFARGFLSGVRFPDYQPHQYDPPIYPVEEVADDWHRFCDLAEQNPLVWWAECPGWFRVEVRERAESPPWAAFLDYTDRQTCWRCDGEGTVSRGRVVCEACHGLGALVGRREFARSRDAVIEEVVRYTFGQDLFGPDHPLFA